MNAKLTALTGRVVARAQLLVTYITDGASGVERGALGVNWSAHPREFGEKVSQPFERVRNSAMSHTLVEITSEYIAIGDIMDDGFHGTLMGKIDLKDLPSSLN